MNEIIEKISTIVKKIKPNIIIYLLKKMFIQITKNFEASYSSTKSFRNPFIKNLYDGNFK